MYTFKKKKKRKKGGSPWYKGTGWLGIKHQLTYLITYPSQTRHSLNGSSHDWSGERYQSSCLAHCLLTDPRLKRGFSNIIENETLVNAARTSVLQDIREDNHHQMFATFVLPDLTIYPEDFRAFLKKELIESSTLNSLQLAGVWKKEGRVLGVGWGWRDNGVL